jgi:hypothetical protein
MFYLIKKMSVVSISYVNVEHPYSDFFLYYLPLHYFYCS